MNKIMNLCTKCSQAVKTDSIQCLLCQKWTHMRCVNFSGRDKDDFFLCENCDKGMSWNVPGVKINTEHSKDTLSHEIAEKVITFQETPQEFEHLITKQSEETINEIKQEFELNAKSVIPQDNEEIVSFESIEEVKISKKEEPIIKSDDKHSSLKIKFSKVKGKHYKIENLSDTNNNDPQMHTKNNELQISYINELPISDNNELPISDNEFSDNNDLPIFDNNELIPGEKIQNESNNKLVKRKSKKNLNFKSSGSKKKNEKKNTLAQQTELGEVYFSTHINSEVDPETSHTIYTCQSCIKFKPTIHVLNAKKHALKHEKTAKRGGEKKQKSVKTGRQKKEKWVCSSCDFKSVKKGDLIKHSKEAHPNLSRDTCSQCGKSFIDYKTLKRHIANVHLGIKNIACNQCPYKCRDTHDLNRHIENNHEPKPKVTNNIIESTVVNINKDGISTNVETKDFPLHCQICDKGYFDLTKLNRHLKSHTGDNLLKCEQCDKTFRDNFNLNRHMRTHNKIAIKYACNFCSKTFARENKFLNHLNKDHKEYINPENVNEQIIDPVDDIITQNLQNDIQELNREFDVNDTEMADEFSSISNLSIDNTIALYLDVKNVDESENSAPFDIPQSAQSAPLDSPLCGIPDDKDSNIVIDDIQIFNVSELHKTNNEEDCNTVNKVVCDFCDNVFASNYNLLRHIQDVHNQEIIECKKCHIIFEGKESFLNHRPCKWTCTSCNRVFLKHSSYISHQQNKHCD